MNTQHQSIFLRVENPQHLEYGSLPRFSPSVNGATIGSGAADWRLYDAMGSVDDIHAAVRMIDGRFSLVDICGRTYINHYQDPLGKLQIVALNDTDQIRIGKYMISVHIDQDTILSDYGVAHLRELEIGQLVGSRQEEDLSMKLMPADFRNENRGNESGRAIVELAEKEQRNLDPLFYLEGREMQAPEIDFIAEAGICQVSASAAQNYRVDLTGTIRESISPYQHKAGEPSMTEKMNAQHVVESSEFPTNEIDHIASAPLLNSLGLQLEELNTEQAHLLLSEVGHALKAAINGLLVLYRQDKRRPMKFSLLGTSNQLIEDNPLRMDLSYEETVKTLFSMRKSLVHLSQVHAVEESIQNIQKNQEALIKAIQEGLMHLLQAFSPDNLERRFHNYRRDHDIKDVGDAWAWQMYKHYYEEIESSRQAGLEKLFWDVFEQAYDREMRKTSTENEQ